MAAYTENFAELRFGGPAWDGQETWSCGLKLRHPGGDALGPMLDEAQATIEDMADIVLSYFQGDSGFSGGCLLEWVRLNPIDADTGRYAFPNQPLIYEFEELQSSGKNAGVPQVAYCVTLRASTIRRGPGARGRWYVPCTTPNPPVTTTGVMSAQVAQPWANAAGSFLTAIRDLPSGDGPNAWTPWLFGQSPTAPSDDSAIGTVSVGNVFDTQRRRREQIVETYFNATTWDD